MKKRRSKIVIKRKTLLVRTLTQSPAAPKPKPVVKATPTAVGKPVRVRDDNELAFMFPQ